MRPFAHFPRSLLFILLLLSVCPYNVLCSVCNGRESHVTELPHDTLTFTAPSTHVTAYGKVENDYSNIICEWYVDPLPSPNGLGDVISYIELVFEYIYVGGGSLHLTDGDGTELMVFRPAQQTLPFPLRNSKPPLKFKWYGLSEGRTAVEFEFGYSAVSFSNKLPKEGYGEHSTFNNNTDATMLLHQPFTKVMSPDVDRQLSTLLDYRYLISGDSRISDTISSPITVMMTSLYFPDGMDNITFYDGATIYDPVIASLTGTVVPNEWIMSR